MPKGVYEHPEVCLQNLCKGRVKGSKNLKPKKPKNWKRTEAMKAKKDKAKEDKKIDERVDDRFKDIVDSGEMDKMVQEKVMCLAKIQLNQLVNERVKEVLEVQVPGFVKFQEQQKAEVEKKEKEKSEIKKLKYQRRQKRRQEKREKENQSLKTTLVTSGATGTRFKRAKREEVKNLLDTGVVVLPQTPVILSTLQDIGFKTEGISNFAIFNAFFECIL
jgi:hypothetical protein